jgi:succinate dehydrogenase/fumarate reductase-like Fe-S protein
MRFDFNKNRIDFLKKQQKYKIDNENRDTLLRAILYLRDNPKREFTISKFYPEIIQ